MTGPTGSGKSTTLAVDGRHREPRAAGAHHDRRGPDRVPAQAQELRREPARGRGRHALRSRRPSSTSCVRTPTSSSSARCVTSRRSRPRSPPPRPGTSSSPRCTRRTRRRRSTASSTCSRRTSSSRCGCSSPTTLQGVVTQQLLQTVDGQGRAVVAVEVLIARPAIRNLIREGKVHQIYSIMQAGGRFGMQTMDQSLAHLVKAGRDQPAARVRTLPRPRGAPPPDRRRRRRRYDGGRGRRRDAGRDVDGRRAAA